MKSVTAIRSAAKHHAPFRIPITTSIQGRSFHVATRTAPPSLLRTQYAQTRIADGLHQRRWESTTSYQPRPLTESQPLSAQEEKDAAARKAEEPAYEMTFTCRKCLTRSSHRITKQAYHFGTTLITCPGCKNRHLISDNLKIFGDKNMTIEDLLREKGEFLKKGRLGEDGDIEFYDDKPSSVEAPDGSKGAA